MVSRIETKVGIRVKCSPVGSPSRWNSSIESHVFRISGITSRKRILSATSFPQRVGTSLGERGRKAVGSVRFSLAKLSGPLGSSYATTGRFCARLAAFFRFFRFFRTVSTSSQHSHPRARTVKYLSDSVIFHLRALTKETKEVPFTHLPSCGVRSRAKPKRFGCAYERNERMALARLLGRVTGVPVPGSVIHWETNHIHPHNAIGAGLPLDNTPRLWEYRVQFAVTVGGRLKEVDGILIQSSLVEQLDIGWQSLCGKSGEASWQGGRHLGA